ncbi:MAG: hypothetical protein ACYDDF_12785 [Thermoplasmatota archaeon]
MSPPLTVWRVRRLARHQRVVPHPLKYHAGNHGLGFQECVAALESCREVVRDERADHREGWRASAPYLHGRTLRVDVDLHDDAGGELLLVVTAFRV